jgi:hypothetical protein
MDENELLIILKSLRIKFPSVYRHIIGMIRAILAI